MRIVSTRPKEYTDPNTEVAISERDFLAYKGS